MEKGRTINPKYCASLLDQLKQKIKKKMPALVNKKVLFQDKNSSHKAVRVMAKINELKFEVTPQQI